MAELIPLDYRINIARGKQLRAWALLSIIVAAGCAAGLSSAYFWKQRRLDEYNSVDAVYKSKTSLILQAKELRRSRGELAGRMEAIQNLIDDKTLLSLLHNVTSGFSKNDLLEYVNVDAHRNADKAPGAKGDSKKKYSVRINGCTVNENSHAELVKRLTEIGAKSDPPIAITPESLRREGKFDGHVMHFQILCEQPLAKAN